MKIVPYRVRFEVDLDSVTGKYRYSKPTSDMLEAEFDENRQAYKIKTHDRGDNAAPGPYYQVAFRIEDPSPYSYADLELRLDSTVYRNSDGQIKNDLYCDPKLRDTPNNLWYQQSRYEFDKKEQQWRIVGDTKKNSLPVDCITTSGVFKPIVIRNGKVLDNIDLPWIYVLPSSVALQDYQDMLSDLINLHDSIIRKDDATVGIGKLIAVETDTERMRKEFAVTEKLEKAIKEIIESPSELQGKEYAHMPIRKIHHYDSRVMREYIRHGMSGKVLGISYYEDHDTYENRIIKFMLKKIQAVSKFSQKKVEVDDSDRAAQEEFGKSLKVIEKKPEVFGCKVLTIDLIYNPRKEYPISIKVTDDYRVQMIRDSHAPFSAGKTKYIKLSLQAKSKKEVIFYLTELEKVFAGMGPNHFKISCTVTCAQIERIGNTDVRVLNIEDITSINEQKLDRNQTDISKSDYWNKLKKLCVKNEFFSVDTAYNSEMAYQEKQNSIQISSDEREKMEVEIRKKLARKSENVKAYNKLWEQTASLAKLLNEQEEWFGGVSDLLELIEIRPTAKFRMNRNYQIVYQCLTEMMEDHAVLSSDFDVNAFGVIKTESVYEYWVFYRLLFQLQSIGFRVDEVSRKALINHYRDFVQGKTSKASGFSVKAVRTLYNDKGEAADLHIEIGYEKSFEGKDIDGNRLTRKPDYYLCISEGESKHWYFMDAKYKCFSKYAQGKVSYPQEIYDVALSKYMADMTQIFKTSDEFCEASWEICGSYIVMADVDDLPSELSVNKRLFGGPESILKDQTISQKNELVTNELIDSRGVFPAHRYGAICLAPSHTDELQSLLELIFEYIEPEKADDHVYLEHCWSCKNPNYVHREKKETKRSTEKYPSHKYYFTCPVCSAFRVDNHCVVCGDAIIKHTTGNYHLLDRTVANPQWAFLCPNCGAGVNGLRQMDEEEIDKIAKESLQESNKKQKRLSSIASTYDNCIEPPQFTTEELESQMPPDQNRWW